MSSHALPHKQSRLSLKSAQRLTAATGGPCYRPRVVKPKPVNDVAHGSRWVYLGTSALFYRAAVSPEHYWGTYGGLWLTAAMKWPVVAAHASAPDGGDSGLS